MDGCRSQKVEDFLDEDELEDMRKSGLQVRAEYDTFGSTAAEHARRAANAEASTRDRGHLTFVPDAIITPVADSMGGPPALVLCNRAHAPPTLKCQKSQMHRLVTNIWQEEPHDCGTWPCEEQPDA